MSPILPKMLPETVLTCTASGYPPPTFQWINLADNFITHGVNFTVAKYDESGENYYEMICLATNTIRSETFIVQSDIIRFIVISKL